MRLASLALTVACLTQISSAQDGYIWPQSAAPGETVTVHATSLTEYQVRILRSSDFGQETEVLHSPVLAGQVRPRTPGSYAFVPTHPDLEITGPITLEAWVRPLTAGNGNFQGILSKYDSTDEAAYNLYLMPTGEASFYLGATGQFNAANRLLTTFPLNNSTWYHLVATWDGTTKRLYVNGQLNASASFAGPIHDTTEPVRVGVFAGAGALDSLFDGQIDSPVVYSRALSQPEIAQRVAERAAYTDVNPGVLAGAVAQWNFNERDGVVLSDATGNGHDMTLVNYGTRGVAGPSPRMEPQGSHSIRFASNEEINPGWPADWSFTISPQWEPGFYVVQIGARRVPLIVKPDPTKRQRIAVLAATNTWHAYNTWRQSLYNTHPGGDIVYFVGMKQPNAVIRPSTGLPGGVQHLVDAERFLYTWLDDNGYPFDIHTDLDLHQDPTLLASYDVLILNGHSEYWSHEMIDHVEAFQAAGGSLVNLSGNTMWTLITYDATFSVMEARKHPHGSGTVPASERWHATDDQPIGGTLRCIGRPEHEVIGTGYGIGAGNADGWGLVLQPQHWIFAGTGVTQGQTFGTTGLNGGSMMGYEIDVVEPQWTPPNVEIIAVGQYPVPTLQLGIANCQNRTFANVTQGGDVIYYDHPGGGGVFGIPSVTVAGTLVVDAVASQMVRNVLNRFLDVEAASCSFRNGSGVNTTGFDCLTPPILGTTWQSSIATTPTTIATAIGLATAPAQVPLFTSEILINLVPSVFLQGLGTHDVPIPSDSAFLGVTLFAQGFRVDQIGGGPVLVPLNAQDVIMGPSGL